MIYTLNQISNIDTALLYPYRILKTRSNMLNAMYKYTEPIAVQLQDYTRIQDGLAYAVVCELNQNKIPYIEFVNSDLLSELASIYEVETTETGLIFKTTERLTEAVDILIYEVYSLQQIEQIMAEINEQLIADDVRIKELEDTVDNLNIENTWAIDTTAKVPNLVMIKKKDGNKLFGDSEYMLSGALDKQLIVNPSQYELESMVKCITTQLTLQFLAKNNNVVEGFYGGLLSINSYNNILVLRNCDAVINLEDLRVKTLIIDNCPYVFIKTTKSSIHSTVSTVEIRHSNVVIDENIEIERIMLSRRSTVNQINGIVGTLLLLEAGSTYYVDSITDTNKLNSVELKSIQGTLHIKGMEPYMHSMNIGFRKGQVEDPLPVSKLKVDITIKKSGGGDTPIPPTPTDPIVDPGNASERCHVLYVWLRKSGFSQNHTCGILGNIEVESGFDPNIKEGDFSGHKWSLLDFVNYPNSGYGLIQWTFPASHSWLYNWCTAKSYDYDTLDGQIRCAAAVPMGYDLSDSVGQGGYDIFGHDGSGTATYNYSVYKNGNSTYGWAGTGDGTKEEVFSRLNALSIENATRSWLASMERPDTSVIGDRIGRANAIKTRADNEAWEAEV